MTPTALGDKFCMEYHEAQYWDLCFSIFFYAIFYFFEDYEIANYADDTTPYSAQRSHQFVIEGLEKSSAILFEWLENDFMKVNTDKSHLLLSGNTKLTSNIDNNITESEMKQELLGITIDSTLSFEEHVNKICKKASRKLNALARISSYMDIQKQRAGMKSFITSQFSSCPLLWMFHSRKLNNEINTIHERTLRIAYCDKHSAFQQLLEKDNSVSIHHRNLQVLATEMFKVNMNLSPDLMNDIFLKRTNPYTL